ncbi:MAG: hypothetical protein DMF77_12485 [Acidobacteria bacterium]|nr:MAG: hypothetical protein DMF77_12485 [Acidobacteriota bacterium]
MEVNFASLFTTFGVLAVILAMVGVYGVMSWVVSQRTSESGIRMALGARARDVVTMLLAQSLRPILVGLVLMLAAALAAAWVPVHRVTRIDRLTNRRTLGQDRGPWWAPRPACSRSSRAPSPRSSGWPTARSDQAFDIIVRVNGLDWTQDGPSLKVFPKP